jgi:hypothetical protein
MLDNYVYVEFIFLSINVFPVSETDFRCTRLNISWSRLNNFHIYGTCKLCNAFQETKLKLKAI